MKKKTLRFRALLLMFVTLLIFSCKKNDDNGGTPPPVEEKPTIVALAKKVNVLSSLVKALEIADADLIELLSQEGTTTVFAPTNGAFNELFSELEGINSLNDFDTAEEKELLSKILKYHIITGKSYYSSNLSDKKQLKTLQTEDLTVNVDISIYIKGKTAAAAEVVGADNEASNGVVHIIDKIVLPQEVIDILTPKPSIIELLNETDDLSMLKEAIIKTGLEDTFSADGPFTVFAPSNTAVEELFNLLGTDFNSFDDFDNLVEVQILKQILLYHVINGGISSSDLVAGTEPTLFTGESIEVIASGNAYLIGDASATNANFLITDKEASNGYVHVIDKILIPAQVQEFLDQLEETKALTIKELVENTDELSFLKQVLELTGLLEVLGEDGPFTVFAPSNEALLGVFSLFGGAVKSLEDIDTDLEIAILREVLLYHVVPEKLKASDLTLGNINTLFTANTLEVVKTKDGYALVDATTLSADLMVTDITAKNGVIHTVDRILIPESILEDIKTKATITIQNYIKRLEESDQVYQLFLKIGDRFETALNSEFTFFLPTNQAFLDLFDSLDGYDTIADFNTKEEMAVLVEILKYHCIESGKLYANELTNEQILPTAQGETLALTIGQNRYTS